jgi:pimeloyl-ACP methyl ester carboxylesterase
VKLKRVAPFAAALVALLASASTPAAAGQALQPDLPPVLSGIPAVAKKAATCGSGVQCSTVVVPLDRTGQVPGTISLHVEVAPPAGTPRGAVFLIAGGPGQGSAHVFNLSPAQLNFYRALFPGYTIVAYDDRGTGESGLIDCPAAQAAITPEENRTAAAACAEQIGPGRAFYSTAEHAEDLEAVRAALGFDKIALYGVSYGTRLALAYALAHPDHVERMLLDSVVPPEPRDPYGADDLRAMPATLDAFCSNGSCRPATASFSSDVVAVANQLAAKPARGKVVLPNGKTASVSLDGILFLSMVLDADLSPGVAAELPAAAHAARLGNAQPLLRLAYLHNVGNSLASIDLSFGLYLATNCRDGAFPWAPETPVAQRQALLTAAVAALPPGTFGRFGSWAYRFGDADTCLVWPSPSGGATLAPGPLPNVPVLVVSGGFDMRTPTAGGASVIARFPQGQLLVVPGVGHDTIDADFSGCAARAVQSWMQGGNVAGTCPRPAPLVLPAPAFPTPGPAKGGARLGALATYAIAKQAIADAEAMYLAAPSAAPVPGVFGGKLTPGQRRFTLTRYAVARGVTVSGLLKLTAVTFPLTFQGTLKVEGPRAATGLLGLKGTSLRGTLGGRIVGR